MIQLHCPIDNKRKTQWFAKQSSVATNRLKGFCTVKKTIIIEAIAGIVSFLCAASCFADIKDYNPFNLKRSAGVGVRLFLPMFGLMGIDWGWGFDPINGSKQYGGSQFHFVLGQEL